MIGDFKFFIGQFQIGPTLEEHFIYWSSCSGSYSTADGVVFTYKIGFDMESWIPLTTDDLNTIVDSASLTSSITSFTAASAAFTGMYAWQLGH